jgi:PAS domain S-box-containing protein
VITGLIERLEKKKVVCNSAKELQMFIDTANAPIFGIDVEGRVNVWNKKAAEISGFASAEVVGRYRKRPSAVVV